VKDTDLSQSFVMELSVSGDIKKQGEWFGKTNETNLDSLD
jgi:hypothetical protein